MAAARNGGVPPALGFASGTAHAAAQRKHDEQRLAAQLRPEVRQLASTSLPAAAAAAGPHTGGSESGSWAEHDSVGGSDVQSLPMQSFLGTHAHPAGPLIMANEARATRNAL